ncbi:MAG: HD domain-containing protein [Holophagaceae bacterium]
MNELLRPIAEALGPDARLHAVGGAVRDRLLGREGGDWDLATALLPDEVLRRAKAAGLRAIPTGLQHGTVTLLSGELAVEVTTFRGDEGYSDGRRPDAVRLGVGLEEDLARRDFTINALALPVEAVGARDWRTRIVDPFGGLADLEARLIRAVGDAETRFREDGLRPFRACRFASQLGFRLDESTRGAIPRCLDVAAKVAAERVQVELTKLLCGTAPATGLQLLADTGLLDLWTPELRPMIGCGQNAHHRFPVWEHSLAVVAAAPADPGLRWAALLHDVGKPGTRSVSEAGSVHFYGHEGHSLTLAEGILRRLKASHALLADVLALVRHHGMHPDEAWSSAACRRFLRRLDEDGLDLERWGAFRLADQLGKGFGDEPCRANHEAVMLRLRALRDARPPLRVADLALQGRTLMDVAGRPGGPWLGRLQKHLLESVIEDPALNTAAALEALARRWLEGPEGRT